MLQEIENLKMENALLIKLLAEQRRSKNKEERTDILFTDFYRHWLEQKKGEVQSSTFFEYNRIFENYIVPYFEPKGKLLVDMTPKDIVNYYRHLKNVNGMTNNSLIRHHANLYTCFKYAYKEGYIANIVMDKVPRPKEDAHKMFNYYTIDELMELFELSKGSNIYTPILLAGVLGLRRSELLALKWDAVNFKAGTITIRRKMTRDKKRGADRISGNLKTTASQRTLVIPKFLIAHLARLRERTKCTVKREYLEFVCIDEDGELPTLNMITNRFRDFLQKQGLKKIRLHDLRHSCATMLLSLGYSMKDIQAWLGHSNYNTTANTYTHVNFTEKQGMARRLDEIFAHEPTIVPLPDNLSGSDAKLRGG